MVLKHFLATGAIVTMILSTAEVGSTQELTLNKLPKETKQNLLESTTSENNNLSNTRSFSSILSQGQNQSVKKEIVQMTPSTEENLTPLEELNPDENDMIPSEIESESETPTPQMTPSTEENLTPLEELNPNENDMIPSQIESESETPTRINDSKVEPEATSTSSAVDVNPNANPLLFPTEPSEVEIETVYPITLDQALEVALKNNRDLQATRLELERAQSQLDQAKAALFPTLSLNGGFEFTSFPTDRRIDVRGDQVDPNGDGEITNVPSDKTVTGSVVLNYNIYTGGERGARIKRAERQLEQQILEVERISEQTRFDVTSNYYQLQNADAVVAIRQAAVEDATQSLRDAQLLEQAGLGTRFDVLQAEVDLANENQALTRAIAEQRTARRQLAETLSIAQNIELTAADEIQPAGTWEHDLEQSIVQAYRNRAELEQQLLAREIGEQDRQIALSGIRPTLNFQTGYSLQQELGNDEGFGDQYSSTVNLQWTFFDGGNARAGAQAAQKNIEIAEVNFANQRNQIRLQVESAYFDLQANQENIGTTDKAVTTAEERLRLARLRFQAGVGTQTDVINAQRALTEARGNFLQAIIGYNRALNDLQRAVSNQPDNRLFEQP